MSLINSIVYRICRDFCNGIDICPKDGFCEYAKEIKKNIIKIVYNSNDETD